MPGLRLYHLAALVLFAACSEGIAAPDCAGCAEMRVLTDKAAYRPGTWIGFTITNRTTDVLRYDWCSLGLTSRGNADDFPEPQYTPSKRCGINAGVQDVIAHLELIAPGESLRDSLRIHGGAAQSIYRLVAWIVDENGAPQMRNPVVSNTFEVFPAAGSSISSER